MKTIDLCRPCCEARKAAGEKLRPTITGVDRKVRCMDCGRRRFGAAYELVAREWIATAPLGPRNDEEKKGGSR